MKTIIILSILTFLTMTWLVVELYLHLNTMYFFNPVSLYSFCAMVAALYWSILFRKPKK